MIKSLVAIVLYGVSFLLSGDVLAQKNSIVDIPDSDGNTYCFSIPDGASEIFFSDGEKLYTYNIDSGSIQNQYDIKLGSDVVSMKALDVMDLVFLGCKDGKLVCMNTENGKCIGSHQHHAGRICAIEITRDEMYLLCGCENGMIYKHSLNDISDFEVLYEKSASVSSIKINSENQFIAISSGDGTISLLDEKTFEIINEFNAGKKWVRDVAFNKEKNQLISTGDDGFLREWKLTVPDQITEIKSSRISGSWVLSVDVSQDGNAECWGGLDHKLNVRSTFGTYNLKLKGPVLQAQFLNIEGAEIFIVCSILGDGIKIIPLKDMNFKHY